MPANPVTTLRCKECTNSFTATRTAAGFCTRKCRQSFNNRRAQRGAQLYDLFMAIRFERALAKRLKLWSMICRLASNFKHLDDRDGRKSWNDPQKIINHNTSLHRLVLK